VSHHIHINAVGIGPGVLEVLFQSLTKRVWNLVEPDELFDLLHLGVVSRGARVQPLDDGAHVTEDARVHERCATWPHQRTRAQQLLRRPTVAETQT